MITDREMRAMVTDGDIVALQAEAEAHGDSDQAELCARALRGDEAARAVCERVIDFARSQA